ncbi:MAG TPA: hypothetical protein ENG51_04770 [Deltaproteobacteria bacterium]|nr:hypothetical protein [Deltaproteobacteria bacterium]
MEIGYRKFLLCFVLLALAFFGGTVLASSVVSVVANGKIGYVGQITDEVRQTATKKMLVEAIKQVLEELPAVSDTAIVEEFIKERVEKSPDTYVESYRLIAELRDKKYFQVIGKVNVKKSLLEKDFNSYTAGEEPEENKLTLVLLVSEYNPRTNEWDYWWKIPPDKKQRLYFTRQLGKELEARGVLVVNKVGKEKILLQSTNFQTPFVTTDAAIQLGLIYRTAFVVIGNVHLNEDVSKKAKYLVASLQILSTENGESIAEIIEKKKVRSNPRKSKFIEMARVVAPRIVDEMKTHLARASGKVSPGPGPVPTQVAGEYTITIEISNLGNLHSVELLQRYFGSNDSPVTEIESVTLEHRKVQMVVKSEVDGTLLARKIMTAFPNEEEFSVLSSSEDSIKISSSHPGVL